jgi:hypothetical protein
MSPTGADKFNGPDCYIVIRDSKTWALSLLAITREKIQGSIDRARHTSREDRRGRDQR